MGMQEIVTIQSENPTPMEKALDYLTSVQNPAGYWEAEMVWNTMLLSQYVITQKIIGRAIDAETRRLIVRHYQVTINRDGSWGMHGEGPGYVFMTGLAYVALRLLGLSANDPLVAPARAWLSGRVLGIPSWGKFWLSMIGLYEYVGMNPIPPELFIVPESLPIHPNNFYCHTRYIYLGIAYLYGKRFRADLGPITEELRRELYDEPYDSIDFAAHRHDLDAADVFVKPTVPLRLAYDALYRYECLPAKILRRRALDRCFERILYEVESSRGQGISPVNGLLNCLAMFSVDPNHAKLESSLAAIESWRWRDEAEGIRYCGAHSTAWDTAFAMRAILAAPAAEPVDGAASKRITDRERMALHHAYRWLLATQMQEELPDHVREAREPIVGGWCFSDGQHRWPVSDCTAEALTAILEMRAQNLEPAEHFSNERLEQAARFILRRQNDDGGFGSYERRRGSLLLDHINPSEMYGNCMTERSYTECTASCVGALCRFRGVFPDLFRAEIDEAIERAVGLLRSRQLADGSYLGFWGVNFTYGIFHVVEALSAAGISRSDPAIARAAEWLIAHQKEDGGWGEHWKSCMTDQYVEHPESQVAMTAWAVLALEEAIDPKIGSPAIERGLTWLRAKQQADGSWPQQSQSGIFFSTAMLDYRLYKDYFPTWALKRGHSTAI